ncbi:MAG: hypothetical protein JST44_23685 [Cyanobacteria bacterium SZAS LIN-5]|nr:hypothetical protein [Cyanobacteria bacterium SZAS LIN-5]
MRLAKGQAGESTLNFAPLKNAVASVEPKIVKFSAGNNIANVVDVNRGSHWSGKMHTPLAELQQPKMLVSHTKE